jgi:hypothetical protein
MSDIARASQLLIPLEWQPEDSVCTKWRAAALGGHYELVLLDGEEGGWSVNFSWGRPLSFWFIQGEPDEWGPTGPKAFDDIEDAKSAAEADRVARVLGDLLPAARGVLAERGQAVSGIMEQLNIIGCNHANPCSCVVGQEAIAEIERLTAEKREAALDYLALDGQCAELMSENRRLTAENERLRAAIKPFADHAGTWTRVGFTAEYNLVEPWGEGPTCDDDEPDYMAPSFLTVGHLTAARLALAETGGAPVSDIADRIVVDDGQQSLDRRDQCAEAGAEIKRLTAENQRLRRTLSAIDPEIVKRARAYLGQSSTAQDEGDYGTPEGTR